MLDAYSSILLPEILASRAFVGEDPAPLPSPGIYTPVRTADGHMLGLIAQQHQFAAICEIVGRKELVTDERFAETGRRFAGMDELIAELEHATVTKTTAAWIEMFWTDGRVAMAPVKDIDQFIDDEQVRHRDIVFTLPHAEVGEVRHLAPFARFAGVDIKRFSAAPVLDQQGNDIRARLAAASGDAAWDSPRE